MKAISLWEPWATLIAMGIKTVETRSWYTKYRGELIICASSTDKGMKIAKQEDLLWKVPNFKPNFGMGIAVVNLIDCISTNRHAYEKIDKQTRERIVLEERYGDYSQNRFMWIFENIRPLPPFPVKGKQGFFEVTA